MNSSKRERKRPPPPRTDLSEPTPKKRLLDIPPNPYGIQPAGNYWMNQMFSSEKSRSNTRDQGLGYLSILEDQDLVSNVLILLTAVDLSVLCQVSKSLYIFSHYDDLWRELVLDKFGGDWSYKTSWKNTYINRFLRELPVGKSLNSWSHRPILTEGFYSDMLYDEYQASSADLNLIKVMCSENMDRRSGLTLEEFNAEYGIPNRPCVITDIVPKWPAFTKWTKELLVERFKDKTFQVGRVDQTLDLYFRYCTENKDEAPLYLFDNLFAEKYPDLLEDYQVPEFFREDFFELLDDKISTLDSSLFTPIKGVRPSYRWLLMGPARSGSTFHKDPNSTSAWNGLISGLKLWIMYPPDIVPPAVFPSLDEAKVTTPTSVTEWFLRYYKKVKKSSKTMDQPLECLQRPGDLVFIPNGWWHQVLNLEDCIGVTQNVVSRNNLNNVVHFLKHKKHPQLWQEFSKAMNVYQPQLLESAIEFSKAQDEKSNPNQSRTWSVTVPDPIQAESIVEKSTFSFSKLISKK